MEFPAIDFTNWRVHPTDNRYILFFFKTEQESNYFKDLLIHHKLWFEYHFDTEEPIHPYYFAVNIRNEKEIIRLNHLTIGHFRTPFLPYMFMRYALLVGMFLIILLAIIGYFTST